MKCPSCEFENMPGQDRCARCKASLHLADIDFEPPRASGPIALRHTRYRFTNVFARFVFGLSRFRQSLCLPEHVSGTPLGALILSIVPGMGQVVLRQRVSGWSLLGAWCILMLLSLAWYGSAGGGWWRAAAVVLHATAIAMIMRMGLVRLAWLSRLMFGILMVVALQLTLYRGITWLIEGMAGALPIARVTDVEPIHNGDTVLYTGRWSRPEPFERGDLVVYRLERGYGADRIIGLEGERVSIESGRILIDGQPLSGVEPVNGSGHFPDFSIRVKAGHYAVLPSNVNWYANGQQGQQMLRELLRRNCHVRDRDIDGRVFWRLRPFRRFGEVE